MLQILTNERDLVTTELVQRAFERCFTRAQIRLVDTASRRGPSAIVVAIAPDEGMVPRLEEIWRGGGKVILLGRLGPGMAALAGVETADAGPDLAVAAECAPAFPPALSESRAALAYAR